MQLFRPILSLLIFLLNTQHILGARSTATSFCKCVCFNNSTIIALNPPSSSSSTNHNSLLLHRSPAAAEEDDNPNNTDKDTTSPSTPHHKLTCADCNRAFCLDYRLPICEGAKEKDVFATCFQRDSIKDETVVILFLFATTGLLGWALVRPWIEKLRDTGSYNRVAGNAAPQLSSSSNRRTRTERLGEERDTIDVDDAGHENTAMR